MTTINPAALKELRWQLGWTPERIADYLDVNLQTYRRWEAGQSRIPKAVYRLLDLLTGCDLGNIHPDWRDFTLGHDGQLYVPTMSRGLTPGMIAARHWDLQLLSSLKQRIKQLEREAAEPRQLSIFNDNRKVNTL